jgi:hypothetical protein
MKLAWLWRFLGVATTIGNPEKREQLRRFSGIVRLDRI